MTACLRRRYSRQSNLVCVYVRVGACVCPPVCLSLAKLAGTRRQDNTPHHQLLVSRHREPHIRLARLSFTAEMWLEAARNSTTARHHPVTTTTTTTSRNTQPHQ
ncbi:hypothetical protein E2C01_094327 [Portunus trituberculatus]|uniref:Uncharacterized protein n=1 Tax=Portunus trituberculatus TaxID=210409 RepID=A0A5B7JVV0_PORTR|nr:hypothetical protein [Portunus trituberculatus]